LDYQDYPIKAAELASMNRRTLGIGVINFANYLAKNNMKYSDGSANNLTHKTFEAIQYYLLQASMNLAKEYGACPLFNETTYSKGILPIDTYKRDLDKVCNEQLHLDWEALRQQIKTHGLRNSTLSALMPSETSSQISNATNGIEPPRGLISVKASKDGQLKQVVPDFDELKNKYELLWNMPSNDGYLQLVGIMQKFIDQAISANTNYDPVKFDDQKVPMKVLLKDLLTAYKLGVKTLYYHNTRDGASDQLDEITSVEAEDDGCAGGACKI
ncbi:MAG: ribonucleotide-diphosphate reductase subunit alpha, partial [Parashewanella sp.]